MTTTHEVVIVGAGFGGMGAAIGFHRLGIDDIVIVEREDDLGGTWHVNRYPGLAVDIASMTYSYSFEANPYWSRLYAPGSELKRYAEHVADKYDLRRHMRFGVAVRSAVWEDDSWLVTLSDGSTLRARYLVTATGFLSQPHTPDIPGIDTFAGKIIHTADWDDSYDLAGKRVAVIGTGATAVQLIPELARVVDDLTVYQRTPIWVVPKLDGPIPGVVQQLFARVPLTQRIARFANTSLLELLMVTAVLHFKQANRLNRGAADAALRHLHRQVADPELRRKLTPDYDFGCKRPTFSNDYYRTFTEPHVHLETDPIDHVEAYGLVTAAGTKTAIDALVLATGFNLWETNFPAIELVGREGRELGTWWRKNRFQAYQGIAVPGFPNYLTLASPYSYSGLSYFTTIEAQMRHISRLFGELRRRGATRFEVSEQANDAFLDRVTDKLGDSVFYRGRCQTSHSYYFDPHGEASILRPTSTINALREAGRFPLDDYVYA
jgi:cation diffusion facilitator CzcD-associated flavoprotein CzcO